MCIFSHAGLQKSYEHQVEGDHGLQNILLNSKQVQERPQQAQVNPNFGMNRFIDRMSLPLSNSLRFPFSDSKVSQKHNIHINLLL